MQLFGKMSTRSILFNFLLRNRHLLSGKRRKERFDMNTSIKAFREQCEKGASRLAKLPPGITVRKDKIAGLQAEWLTPEGACSDKVILYIHGGGYVSGSCSDHRAIVSKFAAATGFTCLVFEYRLAPEHPFPAAPDDSLAAYRWLLSHGYANHQILIAGESAGGGLVLATLLALRDQQVPLPAAAVAISPWTDLTCSGDSYHTKNRYSLAPLDSWFVFGKHYTGLHNPANPYISPVFGDPAGLPPLFINAGTDDELYDDGAAFAKKAADAGVEVSFTAGNRQVHCYPLLAPLFPEATEAMNEIVAFIKRHLNAEKGQRMR